jgi:hypothetical protein
VIDVAAAVALAQGGGPGVLLSGNRIRSKLHLTWSGDTSRYTLTLTSAGASRVVLSASTETSAWLRLQPGRAYAFTVSAIGPTGATSATSAPLTVALPSKH